MAQQNPFHSGELAVQRRAGETEMARRNGAAIANTILGGARPFLKQQPMVLFASRDEREAMWASLVFGHPGFLASEDGKRLEIDLNQALIDPLDPVWENLDHEGRLGSLVIELATRRRIRINGPAQIDDARHLWIHVEESYPACPKYITRRHIRLQGAEPVMGSPVSGELAVGPLPFASANAIFVATRSPERGYDISHRGGSPGFVKVVGPRTVRWPEFPGNSMFNTLGNLLHDPHAAVVVPDFENHRIVQLSGTAATLWDQPDPDGETGGTHRFVEFTAERWRLASLPAAITGELLDYSPFNPPVVRAR
jgi:predicted pyridoxine 5'-phosphate oxidase superfamily flavin-nucleotide-binding protein